MKVVVCVKSVKADLFLKDSDKSYAINPYDVYAMNIVKKIKQEGNIEVIALLMGRVDKRIAAEVKKLGADRIIFISDIKMAGADTLATTYVLSEAIKKIGQVDFIVCGDHAIDGETGHVAAGIAQRLDFDFLANVDSIEYEGNSLECRCSDKNYEYKYRAKTGTVLSVSKCELKEITLSIMQLKRMESISYELWNVENLGLDEKKCGLEGSRTKVVGVQQMNTKNCRNSVSIDMANNEDISLVLKILKGEEHKVEC